LRVGSIKDEKSSCFTNIARLGHSRGLYKAAQGAMRAHGTRRAVTDLFCRPAGGVYRGIAFDPPRRTLCPPAMPPPPTLAAATRSRSRARHAPQKRATPIYRGIAFDPPRRTLCPPAMPPPPPSLAAATRSRGRARHAHAPRPPYTGELPLIAPGGHCVRPPCRRRTMCWTACGQCAERRADNVLDGVRTICPSSRGGSLPASENEEFNLGVIQKSTMC
jgi:hypothetical protein